MRTLDQLDAKLEKRIPVSAENTPGDNTVKFKIDQPGSYYLTGNISTTINGIAINAAGVTLDLNGFQIKGLAQNTGTGINVGGNDCVIKNGSITGFTGYGVFATISQTGGTAANLIVSACKLVGVGVTQEWQIVDCIVHDSGRYGISTDKNDVVTRCKVFNNQLAGIALGENSVAIECTATGNKVGIDGYLHCGVFHCNASGNTQSDAGASGIVVDAGSTVEDCVAGSNVASASAADGSGGGIQAGDGSTIKNCTAEGNTGHGIQGSIGCTVSGCTANNNGKGTTGGIAGILTSIRASISGCTAVGNKGDGIVFSGDSFVLNNHASLNTGAGFHDLGSASRIEGNVSRENTGTGILATTGDTVVRNNSGANGNGAANNQYGPTAGANWGPIGTANNATSPWANF